MHSDGCTPPLPDVTPANTCCNIILRSERLTFSRWLSTRRCRCIRTYLGHLTNLCRSCLGLGVPPTPVQVPISQNQPLRFPGKAHQC